VQTVTPRLPGADRIGFVEPPSTPVDLQGTFQKGEGTPSVLGGQWERFRGDRFDNICDDKLPAGFLTRGPTPMWTIPVGEGYAGAAVRDGRVYLLDYDAQQRADVLRCLSLDDGRDIWSRSYPSDVKRNHGMSRTVPAVTEGYAVTLGPKCQVLCVRADDGEYLWGLDLVTQFRTKVPPWYAGQCPLIDGDRVILAPGGDALMIAAEIETGKVLWKTPNPRRWEMTHASIIPMTLAGRRTYVYCASGGVVGVSAEDGSVLWETSAWRVSMATVPSPVAIDGERVFLSGGYGAGSMMLRIKSDEDGKQEAEIVYRLSPQVFGSEQQTPVYYGGSIYGVIPGGQLVCLDPETGKQRWASGAVRFGIGPYLIYDGRLILMNDTGKLTVAAASAERFEQLGQWTVLDKAHESWGPMTPVSGRLIARDFRRLICLDLTSQTERGSP
jgi:outer membrane protein assembly factor BamB